MAKYILSHDIGTTSHKCVVFNEKGEMVASAAKNYSTYYDSGGIAEQDPSHWWDNFIETTSQVMTKVEAKHIAVLSFSAHMNGCLPVNQSGIPLMRSMLHADTRSSEIEGEVYAKICEDKLYEMTGNRIDARYPLLKMYWLRKRRPEIYRETAFFLQAKDYLVFKITGNLGITDYSDASLTGAFHLEKKMWEESLFNELELDLAKMPRAVPSTEIVGTVQKYVAAETGLMEGTPVVIGGGDGACATIGAGCLHKGDSYISLGTTAWVSKVTDKPLVDPNMRVFTICDLNPQHYNVLGTMQTAGAAFEWAINLLSSIVDWRDLSIIPEYDQFALELKKVPAGARGLIFHPYLLGERSPIWNEKARGGLFGLRLDHDRFDVAKAVLEGIAFALGSIYEVMNSESDTGELRMIGGLSRSESLNQIISDVLQRQVQLTVHSELATSLGAAIAGGVGVQMFPSFQSCQSFVQLGPKFRPNPLHHLVYHRQFNLYKDLYDRIKDLNFQQ